MLPLSVKGMILIKINGLDELENEFNRLLKNAEKFDSTVNVPFDQVFNPEFMTKHTKFNTISDFFDATPFDSSNFDEIDDSDLDVFVKQNTTFPNWQEMLGEASEIWTENQLFS